MGARLRRRPSFGALLVGVAAVLAGARGVAACGNDFDALFASGDGGAPDDAPSAPIDAATGTLDASTTDGSAVECSPRATSCRPSSGCEAGVCRFACTGCGCSCADYECLRQDGITRCDTECTEGTTCGVLCNTAGACHHTCEGCSGIFTCSPLSKSCTVSCTEGARCETTCTPGAPCSVTCASGSGCLVRCGTASSCDLTCPVGATDCGNGVRACGRPCP